MRRTMVIPLAYRCLQPNASAVLPHRYPWQAEAMCGRYASSRRPEDMVEVFEIEGTDGPGPGADLTPGSADNAGKDPNFGGPNYNVAPTQVAPVVLERMPRPVETAGKEVPPEPAEGEEAPADAAGAETPQEPVRWLRGLTWGLVPSWAKDRSVGYKMINARVESVLDKPAYRRAAMSRRCLVPADGWYEWQASPTEKDAKGKPRKQPFFVHPADGGVIALAGVYELWRDPDRHADDPEAWLATYAVITTNAEPGLDVIHDRMPLVLPPDRWDDWLNPELRDPDAVRALMQAPPAGRFAATAVTNRVNSVRNNGPELLEPAPLDQLRGVVDPATGELIGAGSEPLF